jgi:hypothetical protein
MAMAGALVHIALAFICLSFVHFRHMRWEFSLSIFIGNLLPDAITFGLSALKQGTISVFSVTQDAAYKRLWDITNSPANWLSLGFFIFGLAALLYHFHIIKKRKMEEYDELYVFLLAGILIHLVMDAFIMEQGALL